MAVIGIDIGFGFTKATNGQDSLVFKSIYGNATDIEFRGELVGHDEPGEYLHIEFDNNAYFLGELAERQSHVRSFTLDQNQFVTGFSKVLALGALVRLAERNRPVKLVTGLPIGHYRVFRDELTNILMGRHELTIVEPGGKREQTVINVSHVKVIPQPFGSLFNIMLGNTGQVTERRFVESKVGIVDVGFRTSDYTISDKTRYSQRGSQTTDSGIAQAFSMIALKLREMTGVSVELYRLYDAVANGTIKIRGRQVNLKPIVEDAFTRLATAVSGEANRLWADDWDIDLIVVTGGGGAVLAPFLKPLLNGEMHAIEQKADSRLNNVRGYRRYGLNVWAREERAVMTSLLKR